MEEHKESHTSTSPVVSSRNGLCDDIDSILAAMPIGYRFQPLDEELILDYLKPKVADETLPPSKIKDVDLYNHNPDYFTEMYNPVEKNAWYFFTSRDKKYPKGDRPNRTAGDGYWKAIGNDRIVKFNEEIIGHRKKLIFYRGKSPKGENTEWVMHEFTLHDPKKKQRDPSDMKLDDWVLCKIYKKSEKNTGEIQKQEK